MLEARPLTSTSSLLNKPRTGVRLLIREIPTVHSIVTVSLPDDPISAPGQTRKSNWPTPTSALPPKANSSQTSDRIGFVPTADIRRR